jgi:hypothetical protein
MGGPGALTSLAAKLSAAPYFASEGADFLQSGCRFEYLLFNI